MDEPCSKEELLVFSKRVYDHLIYTLGLDSKGVFWKVSDEDNSVYLLGSVHFADVSVYPINKAILDAFADAESLVVEANVLTPQQEDIMYMQQKMLLGGDQTIDQLITKETYDLYVQAVQPTGLLAEVYNKLKPWYAAMLIQTIQMSEASFDATLGIDAFFLSMANGHKQITEIEGIKFQIDMFDSFSPELQETYLMGILEGKQTSNDAISQIIDYWKAGDVENLESLIFAEEASSEIEKEFNKKIWETRNKNMLQKVERMLSQDNENDYFVVVGAGHMLNDNGIIKGISELGYTVEQIK